MKLVYTVERLSQILDEDRKAVAKGEHIEGLFDVKGCRHSIEWSLQYKSLEEIYLNLVNKALTEQGFNTLMIIACEQMLNERYA